MATLRRREKGTKNTLKENTHNGFRTTPRKLQCVDPEEAKENSDSNDTDFSEPYISLNVLAQVATDTLKKEPRPAQKKLTRRNVLSMERFGVEHIQTLSDKVLLQLFSDLSANEMTRNYTYQCFLMPDKCKQQFTSFGNENRARLQMKTHLFSHIERLIDEANDPDRKEKFVFAAEPVHMRKKRLTGPDEPSPRRLKKLSQNSGNKQGGHNFSHFTALKPFKRNMNKDTLLADKGHLLNLAEVASKEKSSTWPSPTKVHPRKQDMNNVRSEFIDDKGSSNKRSRLSSSTSPSRNNRYAHKQSHMQSKATRRAGSKSPTLPPQESYRGADSPVHEKTCRRIEENEQFIIDLLSRNQPHHDHCYTTIFGKKRGIESVQFSSESSDEEEDKTDDDSDVDVGEDVSFFDKAALCMGITPILEIKNLTIDKDTPIVCCEEIVDNGHEDTELHSGQRPYPPMPKSELARQGKISVPEECPSFSEGEDDELVSDRHKRSTKTKGQEWERRTALKSIRELKGKKKDEKVDLVCKICQDKVFTANATLMYHYRSHAGIKPFVCLLCNTTFTRQHSLNYHMLIHNNQSRFTCKDCGRKFRHPSHFKEHLRRHTGETPYECMDCKQKFKTRNTYKRHLKTRHGKLLTAMGIHTLPKAEFLKVRTRPYRRVEEYNLEVENGESDSMDDDNAQSDSSQETTSAAPSPKTVVELQPVYIPIGILVKT